MGTRVTSSILDDLCDPFVKEWNKKKNLEVDRDTDAW